VTLPAHRESETEPHSLQSILLDDAAAVVHERALKVHWVHTIGGVEPILEISGPQAENSRLLLTSDLDDNSDIEILADTNLPSDAEEPVSLPVPSFGSIELSRSLIPGYNPSLHDSLFQVTKTALTEQPVAKSSLGLSGTVVLAASPPQHPQTDPRLSQQSLIHAPREPAAEPPVPADSLRVSDVPVADQPGIVSAALLRSMDSDQNQSATASRALGDGLAEGSDDRLSREPSTRVFEEEEEELNPPTPPSLPPGSREAGESQSSSVESKNGVEPTGPHASESPSSGSQRRETRAASLALSAGPSGPETAPSATPSSPPLVSIVSLWPVTELDIEALDLPEPPSRPKSESREAPPSTPRVNLAISPASPDALRLSPRSKSRREFATPRISPRGNTTPRAIGSPRRPLTDLVQRFQQSPTVFDVDERSSLAPVVHRSSSRSPIVERRGTPTTLSASAPRQSAVVSGVRWL
jgi:hypothetical protein